MVTKMFIFNLKMNLYVLKWRKIELSEIDENPFASGAGGTRNNGQEGHISCRPRAAELWNPRKFIKIYNDVFGT